jgi:sphingomyelin phosphodiesterase
MNKVFELAIANRTDQCLDALIAKGCTISHIEDLPVCRGAVGEYGNIWIYVIGKLFLDPKRICGHFFDGCGGPKPPIPPNGHWRVPMLNTTKPPRVKPVLPSPDKPKLRVVQLADIHFDKNYVEGSEANCNEPLCCRKTNGTVKSPAGKWGSAANCDIPRRTLEALLEHVASRDDYDYIIWTGDAPPHDVWDQTKDNQLTVLNTLTELFLKYFPKKLLISTVGNHESAPANNYPPHTESDIPAQYSTAWLYQEFANQWTQFGIGQDPAIKNSIQQTASFVTKPYPGLRVISLNTMYCLSGNFWLYLNEYDPDNVLSWLILQLQDAEDVGDKVHIIGHVPPGDTCLMEWSANFYDIVNRYENTITGLFYGHTHDDSFTLFYENGTLTDPIHVAYVSPSVTTWVKSYPSFRIYTIDGNYKGSSYRVLDHETYVMNLDDANKGADPKWTLEYNAMDAYNMSSLLPENWNELIDRFIQDDNLFQQYNNRFEHGPTPEKPCERRCKYDKLCAMRRARSHDMDLCAGLPGEFGGQIETVQLSKQEHESIRNLIEKEFSILPSQCHSNRKQ